MKHEDYAVLKAEANPFLESAMELASSYLNGLWEAVPVEEAKKEPSEMKRRTRLLLGAGVVVGEFRDCVQAELDSARRKAETDEEAEVLMVLERGRAELRPFFRAFVEAEFRRLWEGRKG